MAQVQKPEVRAKILAAGLEAFAERGFRDAAMADIARNAGVATANIYRYFPSKAALFEGVLPDELIEAHDRLLDARVEALADPSRPSGPAQALLEFWAEHRIAVAILLDHQDETTRSSYAASFVERLVGHVEANLDRAPTELDRELLVLVFDNTRRSLASMLRANDDPDRLRVAIEGFWSYQVPGLDGLIGWMRRRR